jgi:hypothetical protein
MTPTNPDDKTPLLKGEDASDTGKTSIPRPGAVAGPPDPGSCVRSIDGEADVNGASKVVKKTPLPWAQLSVVLFLQLTEPLTSEVIYPVSSVLSYSC